MSLSVRFSFAKFRLLNFFFTFALPVIKKRHCKYVGTVLANNSFLHLADVHKTSNVQRYIKYRGYVINSN